MHLTFSNEHLMGYCSEASLPAIRRVISYYRTLAGTDVVQLVNNTVSPAPGSADPDQGADVPADDLLRSGMPCAAPWALFRLRPLDESAFWDMYQLTERLLNAARADAGPVPGAAMQRV